ITSKGNRFPDPERLPEELAFRGARHQSAYAMSEVTMQPIIVVSEEKGFVSLSCNGNIWMDVTKLFLRDFLDNAYAAQSVELEELRPAATRYNAEYALLRAERFITTRGSAVAFKKSEHLTWYYDAFIEYHMELHVGCSIFDVLRDMSNSVVASALVMFQTPIIRKYVKLHADGNLHFLERYSDVMRCFILEYGHKRLGGFFIVFNASRSAILLGHPFVRRDLLHNRYAMKFVAAFCME
ncbi:hypothetical protein AAVH_36846, partial [Aphelenchoides avenae]